LSLQGVASPSLPNYGRAELDRFRGHATAPTKPHDSWVHEGGRAHNLTRARGPRIPCASAGIRRGLHGVLRARVQCGITLISPLFAIALWSETAQLDPLRNLAHSGHCDPL
jgi:hypothetical protein